MSAEHRLWSHVLTPLRLRRLAFRNRLADLRNRRAYTARNVTRRNTREAYELLYSDDVLVAEYLEPGRLAFYEEVADVAAALGPRRVLDVGCGTGHVLRALLDRVGVDEAAGIDYAASALARARLLVPEASFELADLIAFDVANPYDLVICTEVLEHVLDPASARTALGRATAPGGHVLVTVPDGDTDDWEGHVNFWSAGDLERFLRPLGSVESRRLNGDVLLAVAAVPEAPDPKAVDLPL